VVLGAISLVIGVAGFIAGGGALSATGGLVLAGMITFGIIGIISGGLLVASGLLYMSLPSQSPAVSGAKP